VRTSLFLVTCAIASTIAAAASAQVAFAPSDVATVFFISKSDDRNRVDYGIRLDRECRPRPADAMVVYWREFEGASGGRVTHGLNVFEGPVYGVASEDRSQGAALVVEIRALRARPISVRAQRGPSGECTAEATASISGVPARLHHIHVTLGSRPGSVAWIEIVGDALEGGRALSEWIAGR
jgi:hypothetical protein